MIEKYEADEKVQEGWIRLLMTFEAVSVSEEVTKKALESLINKLDSDQRAMIYKKEFLGVKEVNAPVKGMEKGWSQIVEVELIVKRFEDAVNIVMEYGPSSVEVIEPKEVRVNIGEMQSTLNSIGELMHKFAAAGLGGFVFVHGK